MHGKWEHFLTAMQQLCNAAFVSVSGALHLFSNFQQGRMMTSQPVVEGPAHTSPAAIGILLCNL